MLILDSFSNDPRFNIAAEEYLLKERDEDFAFFYINKPSIIVGKHQNAWSEINHGWAWRNNIPVIRRITGGGTVWHDHGNLNFSFILNGEEGKLVNFREYAGPVLDYLLQLGIPAEFGDRNEMIVEGLKVSGNAEHVHRKRVLHHGTLLFSSDMNMLRKALDTDPNLYTDKSVQSVRSKTANIREFLYNTIEISDFRRGLLEYISKFYKNSEEYFLTYSDTSRIEELINEKYGLWSWNIGYSPKYNLEREIDLGSSRIRAELNVVKGQIRECNIQTLFGVPERITTIEIPNLEALAVQLTGIMHDPEAIRNLVETRELVQSEWIDTFVEGLF